MQKNNRYLKKHVPYASRTEFVLAVFFGVIAVVIAALLSLILPDYAIFVVLGALVLYMTSIALIGFVRETRRNVLPQRSIHELLDSEGAEVFINTAKPTVTFNMSGEILWCNAAMSALIYLDYNPIGRDLSDVLGQKLPAQDRFEITLSDRTFGCEYFTLKSAEEDIGMIIFTDITELLEAQRLYKDERMAVAYIAIDNVEDILQYVQKKFGDAVSSVDDKLKSWAASINGIIKSYENDKYIMLFESRYLKEFAQSRFSILDEIRDTRIEDGVSITVSVGIANTTGTLADREAVARDAFDMAIQRGGDQVVYITDDSTEYYGGRTKSVYKRSNVRSRTFASQLTSLIARADNVIVMGHRFGDFDSFGASLGVARLAMLCGVNVKIAVDMRDQNLAPCIELLQKTDVYEQTFVDSAAAHDLLGMDTVVVLVDHNAPQRAQFSTLATKASTLVIIDHHRKIDMLPQSVKLSYIEPSASSTCELVSEMLECTVSSQKLLKEEADMLLSGILLDTKQFTRNTGTRTFGAAQYLRGAGANPTDVYNLFKTAPEDLSKEARFHTDIVTYHDNIAISCCDTNTDDSYRIIASKAADKMLTLKGIDAAFTLVRIGEHIHISGRSNGSVNVQLILEKLGGGGHFDVAGAQVSADTVLTVLEALKLSIDDYIESVKGD